MSHYVLRVVPKHPDFTPSEGALRAAETVAENFKVGPTKFERFGEIRFVDGGENFPRELPCDHCGFDLLANSDWGRVMDAAYEQMPRFGDLSFSCPSCDGALSLYDQSLDGDCYAFASCVIEWEVDRAFEASDDMIDAFAKALGTEVRIVFAHY